MTLEWDKERIESMGSQINFEISPRAYTFQTERFCPHCNRPKSHVEHLVNISKKLEEPRNKWLINKLKDAPKLFTLAQLINFIGAEMVSNGSLQNLQMTYLVVKGVYRSERQEYLDDKNRLRFKYVFVDNRWVNKSPKCYDSQMDRHISLEKGEWVRKTYFDNKAVKEEQ